MADVLLRRLASEFPGSSRRACADDLAMIVRDFRQDARGLMPIFHDYQKFSGLRLNMRKVKVSPLWFPSALRD